MLFIFISLFLVSSALADTIIIKADGSGDYPTIQAVVDAANTGDEIELQIGTYTDVNNRDLDFKGKAITVRSTSPGDPCVVMATIIDCNSSYPINHRGFYFHSGEDANSIVSGLTITRGLISSSPHGTSSTKGAGIYCSDSSPTIENCYIINNECLAGVPAYGAGIYCESDSNPIIIGCNIENNYAEGNGRNHAYGGGICSLSSWPKIITCVISGNTARGGDSYFFPPEPHFAGYAFGGGLCAGDFDNAGSMTVNNCTIVSNNAIGGVGYGDPSGVGMGGGAACFEGPIFITDCIIRDNNADRGGPQVAMFVTADIAVDYSNIAGGFEGTDNIDFDRCFADPCNNDYHLKSQAGRWDPNTEMWLIDSGISPCIDAGDPASDWTTELWPHGKRINMGAYGGTPQASMSLSTVGNKADFNNNGFVNAEDLGLFVKMWLDDDLLLAENINRNDLVNFSD